MKRRILSTILLCVLLFGIMAMTVTVCYADGGMATASATHSTNGYIIKEDGSLWVWGSNNNGQLGTTAVTVNSTSYIRTPTKIMDNVAKAEINLSNGYALKKDGTFWTWGRNGWAQIGSEKVEVNLTSVQQTPLKIAEDVIDGGMATASATHSTNGYIIKQDGSLWVWGSNENGQLGTTAVTVNSTSYIRTPTKIMDNVAKAEINLSNGYALKKDGTFWTWGQNGWAQIGSEEVGVYLTSVQQTPLKIAEDVIDGGMATASATHSTNGYIIKQDGSLWVWGSNNNGQLGTSEVIVNSASYIRTPTKIMDNVVKAEINMSNGYALKKDGTFWTWGRNGWAQIGSEKVEVNLTSVQQTPLKISDNVICGGMATASATHSTNGYIIKEDGSLWVWGSNNNGQLGTSEVIVNSASYIRTPTKIMDNVVKAEINMSNGYALKKDGTFWTWGRNGWAQIGSEKVEVNLTSVQQTPLKIAENVAIPICPAIHVFDDWRVTTPASCTEKGIETHTCTICGTEETREIPAPGHTLTHFEAVKATVEAEGNIEYWTCSTCGKFFIDSSGLIEVSADDVILPRKVKLGDANGNGEVDMIDATIIQRAVTMVPVPYDEDQLMNADVDDDGDLTVMDAAFIQRHATMIKTPYPIGELIE